METKMKICRVNILAAIALFHYTMHFIQLLNSIEIDLSNDKTVTHFISGEGDVIAIKINITTTYSFPFLVARTPYKLVFFSPVRSYLLFCIVFFLKFDIANEVKAKIQFVFTQPLHFRRIP